MVRWFDQILARSHQWKKSFTRILSEELTKIPLNPDGKTLKQGFTTAEYLAQLQVKLPLLFQRAGLVDYSNDLIKIVSKRLNSIDVIWNQLGLNEAKIGKDVYQLPEVLNQLSYITQAIQDGNTAAQSEIARALLEYQETVQEDNQIGLKTLKDRLISHGGILPKYAGTVANTSLFAISRVARKAQSDRAGLSHAKFFHPIDKITRKWCQEHGNTVETWEYWENVQNDTGPNPPSVYGGGFNCRGDLVGFSPEWNSIEWKV